VLSGLGRGRASGDLLVGLDHGDDAAAVRIDPAPDGTGRAVIATADFFTPVVDDAYAFGRIAATNAMSDVWAMGGTPVVAVNLLGWPRDRIPFDVAAEVLRGGDDACTEAGAFLAGGHSIDDPEPKYGLAVTGLADPDKLLRNDAAQAGMPLTLTKPLGLGVLNNRHKATGEWFEEAVAVMTELNRDASRAAVDAGLRAATDVTGFGLLGHLMKMMRASGTTAVIDAAAVPYVDGARRRWPTASCRAAAAATSTGCARTSTRPSTRTSSCCSPTPRPPAACWWSASCLATRWWARSRRPASTRSSSADTPTPSGGGRTSYAVRSLISHTHAEVTAWRSRGRSSRGPCSAS